ncbi:OLC1v1034801C1 [Oldenlandia corymbosa var. corymbosa]|uniref:OLC1v1034801C1 n=1 Tax=Oldenlandia corymbosa var. corymbosa TaxID=529605 RepID=A0AAV1CUC1_OLDCO|nr:OLC1v1034801C1 [Oldenlandia corymbosa var. corymbosa]
MVVILRMLGADDSVCDARERVSNQEIPSELEEFDTDNDEQGSLLLNTESTELLSDDDVFSESDNDSASLDEISEGYEENEVSNLDNFSEELDEDYSGIDDVCDEFVYPCDSEYLSEPEGTDYMIFDDHTVFHDEMDEPVDEINHVLAFCASLSGLLDDPTCDIGHWNEKGDSQESVYEDVNNELLSVKDFGGKMISDVSSVPVIDFSVEFPNVIGGMPDGSERTGGSTMNSILSAEWRNSVRSWDKLVTCFSGGTVSSVKRSLQSWHELVSGFKGGTAVYESSVRVKMPVDERDSVWMIAWQLAQLGYLSVSCRDVGCIDQTFRLAKVVLCV